MVVGPAPRFATGSPSADVAMFLWLGIFLVRAWCLNEFFETSPDAPIECRIIVHPEFLRLGSSTMARRHSRIPDACPAPIQLNRHIGRAEGRYRPWSRVRALYQSLRRTTSPRSLGVSTRRRISVRPTHPFVRNAPWTIIWRPPIMASRVRATASLSTPTPSITVTSKPSDLR